MKTINYKGKGEHSVNELELIIEQQAEELHLIKSGQKPLIIDSVSNSSEHKERIEAYKECFETYIPTDKWDEATLFLSTYGSGLAKDLARKER